MFAINFCLIEIRELAQNLSPEFQKDNFPFSINDLALFRNTLTHDYGNVDFSLYRDLVKKDLPKVEKTLKKFLR